MTQISNIQVFVDSNRGNLEEDRYLKNNFSVLKIIAFDPYVNNGPKQH